MLDTLAVDLLERTDIPETAMLREFGLSGTDQMAMLTLQIEEHTDVVLNPAEISPRTTVGDLRHMVQTRALGNLWSRPGTRHKVHTGFLSRIIRHQPLVFSATSVMSSLT